MGKTITLASSFATDEHNEWQTSNLLDGHLYGVNNIGSAGSVTHLTCVEALWGTTK